MGVVVKGGLLVGTAHFDNGGEAGSGLFGIAFLYIGAAEVQQQVALFFGREFVDVDGTVYFERLVVVAAVEVAVSLQELGLGAVRGLGVVGEVAFDEVEGVWLARSVGRSGNQEVGLGLVDGAGGLFAVCGQEVDAAGVVSLIVHELRTVEDVGGLFDADGLLCRCCQRHGAAQQGTGYMANGIFFIAVNL